jgi:hypothetical protein
MIHPPYPARKRSVWGFQPYQSARNWFPWRGKIRFSDEDVDVSDRNDGKSGRVFSSRHPEVIRWDDGKAGIVEDTPDGDGVADACEGVSRQDPRS